MTARIVVYLLVGVAIASLLAVAIFSSDEAAQPAAAETIPAEPTYAEHIAPIIQSNCVTCHRPGEVAPFSLTSYQDVKKRARQIAFVTEIGFMPPWKPAKDYGHFLGERRLTEAQIETIRRWVDNGAPAGGNAAAAALVDLPRWQLGKPDVVVRFPEPFEVPAAGPDVYRNFVIPMDDLAGKHVRGIAFREDNRHLIHHATIVADSTGTARQQDALDDLPGYEGMEDGVPPGGHFFGWTPGRTASLLDEGMAWTVEPSADLVVQLHMLPSGRAEKIQPEIGLYLTDQAPTKFPSIVHLGATTITIPAGDSDYVVEDSFEMPVDAVALSIYPHAHYLCKQVKVWAELSGGKQLPLLKIDDWDFDWQDEYRFARDVDLPAGSVLRMRYVYDNSVNNPRNPHNPPKPVHWGPRSSDEMADLWLKVLPRDPAQTKTLRAAVGRKSLQLLLNGYRERIAQNPADFDAHSRLGQLYLAQRRIDDALRHLRAAAKLEPEAWHVHYNIGVAHARKRQLAPAKAALQRAIQLDEKYVPALVNLGAVQMMGGNLEGAVGSFRQAVNAKPEFVQARVNLGAALSGLGRLEQAAEQYRKAIELAPEIPEPYNNLASVLMRMKRFEEAADNARRAIELRPAYVDAIKNLGLIHLQQGDTPAAIAQFEKAVQLAPDDEDARTRLTALRNLPR